MSSPPSPRGRLKGGWAGPKVAPQQRPACFPHRDCWLGPALSLALPLLLVFVGFLLLLLLFLVVVVTCSRPCGMIELNHREDLEPHQSEEVTVVVVAPSPHEEGTHITKRIVHVYARVLVVRCDPLLPM